MKVARGEDAWRGRHEPGEQQASADPGPVTCGQSSPSPASLPFSRPEPRGPACEDPAPAPLDWLQPAAAAAAGPRAGGEPQAPRGRLSRSYLTTPVSSVASSTAAAPAVAAAATFLGSAPAAAASSTLGSPLAAGALPPPSPPHTPRKPEPRP